MHYVPVYDRRHNLNIALGLIFFFGKKSGWELDARYNFVWDFPSTQTRDSTKGLTLEIWAELHNHQR